MAIQVAAGLRDTRPDRIIVLFQYDYTTKELVKEIEGARFEGNREKGGPYWHLPKTLRSCYALREQFGENLVVGTDLAGWARERIREQERLGELADATETDLRIDEDGRMKNLVAALNARPFQRPGARFLAESPCPLLADEQGLGKTLQAIAGTFEARLDEVADGRFLVVCPSSAITNTWTRELRRWQPLPVFPAEGTTAKKRQKVIDEFFSHEGPAWLIVNPGMIQFRSEWHPCPRHEDSLTKERRACVKMEGGCEEREVSAFPQLHSTKWSVVICDEVHRSDFAITNPKTKTARSINSLNLEDGGKRFAISGTPMRGRAQDLFGVLQWLTKGTAHSADYRSRWQWMERYVVSEPNQWAKSGKTFTGRLRTDRENELFRSLRPYVLRRTNKEVAADLPDKNHIDVWCDLTGAQRRQYDALVNEGSVEGWYADGVLSELTRARQIANSLIGIDNGDWTYYPEESGKVDRLIENLTDSGVGEDQEPSPARVKTVVATQWARFAQALAKALEIAFPGQVTLMTGATSQRRRNEIVGTFQSDGGPGILVMTTEVGGVSITLDRADTLHAMDETWEPTAMQQLEDRLHRLSRTERTEQPVTIYTYRTQGTVDEAVYETNLDKGEIQKRVMDDRKSILRPGA